jgi:hypothetical protein
MLTAHQRRACQLVIEGQTYEDIAVTLDLTQRTVRGWFLLPLVQRYLSRLIDQEEQLFRAHRSALQRQSVAVCHEIMTERQRAQSCSDDDWAKIQRVRADIAKTVLGWAARKDEFAVQSQGAAALGAGLAAASFGVQRLPEGGLSELIRGSFPASNDSAAGAGGDVIDVALDGTVADRGASKK